LCYLSLFDLRILITPLVSSNSYWIFFSRSLIFTGIFYAKNITISYTDHNYVVDLLTILEHICNKTKDRVTCTSLKTRGELRCSGTVSSSCSTSGTRHVNLVTNPVISHEWGKNREGLRQVEHIRGNLWHRHPFALFLFGLCCLFVFAMRIRITRFVSSHSS
jgi:hypothetical protein